MARCIFENLTEDQAKVLASWFEDCCIWLGDRDVRFPLANVCRDGGYREILDNGDVLVYCK